MQGGPGYRLWSRWVLRLQLAQQAAAAIAYMHEANIIHRDVTANNILVTENYEAKVGGFQEFWPIAIHSGHTQHQARAGKSWSMPLRHLVHLMGSCCVLLSLMQSHRRISQHSGWHPKCVPACVQ